MAEQLTNEFTVNRPVEEAWPIITDLERIAPCMPGAQLQEIEGDTFRGVVKVKLGAINSQFKGEAHFTERDDASHRAVISATGRDTGGRGNAAAEIAAQAESLSPTSSRVIVTTDLHITGKIAQFGRGIMGDVSAKLMAQFAANLNEMLDADSMPDSTEPVTGNGADAGSGSTGASPAGSTAESPSLPPPTADAAVRKIEGPAAEPIDLMEVGGGSVLKRAIPAIVALVIVLILLRRRRS